MQRVAVLAIQQQFRDEAVLIHRGGAPLAGHGDVLTQMPPEVIGQALRSALTLPGTQHFEAFVVQQRDATRPVRTVSSAQAGQEHPVGTAVECVRT